MTARHRLEAVLAGAALALLRRLGPVAASNLGGLVARAVGPLLPVSRVADANLRLAMPELDATARRRVIRGVWDNLGRTAAELPYAGALRRTDSGPGWEIEGAEAVVALAAKGRPALVVTAHLANWEILPALAASFGIELATVYRAASNTRIDRMIRDLRAGPPEAGRAVAKMFAKGSAGGRAAMAHLAGGGMLGMLIDQKMNDGIAVPFFGHPAMTAPAAAALALRYDCPILPIQVQRLGPARFRVIVAPPVSAPATGDRRADTAAMMAELNATLERWIRERPSEWLWLHRRWPARQQP